MSIVLSASRSIGCLHSPPGQPLDCITPPETRSLRRSHASYICRQRVSSDSSHPGIAHQEDGRKERQERRRKRKEYYQKGVSSGEPATCMLYKLANALNFEDNHLLW